MLFQRQKCLLALVDCLGGNVGNLDFQKLLFLYCLEVESAPSYEFVPYRFGGFSYTSYADKRRLIEQGLLADEDQCWQLTGAGRAAVSVPSAVRVRMDHFARRLSGLRGDALVAEAYRRHPYYASRSEIVGRVLAEDESALRAVVRARPAASRPGLCTIGYEGRTLEGYLNRLLQDGVTLLCDVRRNAFSRKYGFSKATLEKACGSLGIRYEHLPELGIGSDERRGLASTADFEALFAAYETDYLPGQAAALSKIRDWVLGGARVALTCFEAQPQACHRHCVAEALERRYGSSLSAKHL